MSKDDILEDLKDVCEDSRHPYLKKPRFYRVVNKGKKPCPSSRNGLHYPDKLEWGVDLRDHMVDLWCGDCGKKFRKIPFRDLPEEWKDQINKTLEESIDD